MKVLMVCHGNICRSPIAHGLLEYKVEHHKLNWEVDSAGTSDEHEGEEPHRRSIACLKRHAIDISAQRSRQITKRDIKTFDLIYVMDNYNYRNVINLCDTEEEMQKVKMIMNELHPGEDEVVPDPYYGVDSDYEHVYQMLDKATDAIIHKYGKR
jgi:protein-tyrosine phosphatase